MTIYLLKYGMICILLSNVSCANFMWRKCFYIT